MVRRSISGAVALVLAAGFVAISACDAGSNDAADSTATGSDAGSDSSAGSDARDASVSVPGDPPATLRTPRTGQGFDEPARNATYLCLPPPLQVLGLTRPSTPWISGDDIIVADIPYVEGSVTWDSEFEMTLTDTGRRLKGNGLPNHPTGTFAVEEGTAAYEYYAPLPAEGYDSAAEIPIAPYDLDITVPRNPVLLPKPACIEEIFTGVVTQTGAAWHLDIAADSDNNLLDPVSALPMDSCWGHPYAEQYHYHGYSWKCFPNQGEKGAHSPLFGYAIDGFGVFGPRGEGGKLVTNEDLDECHGHAHEIEWDGVKKVMYHYHVNNEYPYSIGCFRGEPIDLPEVLQHIPGHSPDVHLPHPGM